MCGELFVCECGWTSCGMGRGCGNCGDCCGEHCECFLPYDSPFTGGFEGQDELYQRPNQGDGLLPTGERVEDMD